MIFQIWWRIIKNVIFVSSRHRRRKNIIWQCWVQIVCKPLMTSCNNMHIYISMDWFIMRISSKKDNYKTLCKCLDKVIVRPYVHSLCFGKCGFINDLFMVDSTTDSNNKIRKQTMLIYLEKLVELKCSVFIGV